MDISKTDLRKAISLLEYSAEFIDLHHTKYSERDKARQCRLLVKKLKQKQNGKKH